MTTINEIDTQTIVDLVTESDGSFALAAERLNKKLGLPYNTITEYEFKSRVATMDVQTSEQVMSRLRALMSIRLYELCVIATDQLKFSIDSLNPADLAKAHSSLVNSFASLTSGATKVQFDFNREIEAIAREFPDIPVEEIKAGIKEIESKAKGSRLRVV